MSVMCFHAMALIDEHKVGTIVVAYQTGDTTTCSVVAEPSKVKVGGWFSYYPLCLYPLLLNTPHSFEVGEKHKR